MERDILKEVKNLTDEEIYKLQLTDEERIALLTHREFEKNAFYMLLYTVKNKDFVFEFIKNNRDILEKNKVKLYKIVVRALNEEAQLKFLSMIENGEIETTEKEKRYILASLSPKNKNIIKKEFEEKNEELPVNYKEAFEMKVSRFGKIFVDFESDIKKYRGWDDMIYVDATDLSDDERKKFKQLCEMCPNMKVYDGIDGIVTESFYSSVQEYLIGEEWIESVLKKINLKAKDIQKVVEIDYLIGQKMSYAPEEQTECEDEEATRALWKSIVSGYGVCVAMAKIENYMFRRIGLKSKVVESSNHAFVKLEDIEIPIEEEQKVIVKRGNTIVDLTWNLSDYAIGALPNMLGKSYQEIRREDIVKGKDTMSHKNDQELADATLSLELSILRSIYESSKVVDLEKMNKGKKLFLDSIEIWKLKESPEIKTKKILQLVQNFESEISRHQQEISRGLTIFLHGIDFRRSVVDRVYDKSDKEKKPVLYVYMDFPQEGKKFFYLDGGKNLFIEMSQKEFEEKFESYEYDIENNNGLRMWESPNDVEEQKNLEGSKKGENR